MDSALLMFAIQLWEDSPTHSKATIQRWVSVVQEHTDLRATKIPVLGFPQRNQQKRHCCTDRHEYHKPTDVNKTPQMASRFYLRPRLLCRLTLWYCFTSSCFVVPQFLALESSLVPQILHRFGAPTDPPPSRRHHRHPSYPIALAIAMFAAGFNRLLTLLQMAGERFGPRNKRIFQSEGTASKPLGRTTIPLQQQRPATCEQRVRTSWKMGATGVNYSLGTGVEWLNNGWNNGCHQQYNSRRWR